MQSEQSAAPTAPKKHRGIRSGVLAFLSSLVLVVWVVLLAQMTLLAVDSEQAGAVATVLFLISWVLVPLLIIGIVVFAVVALLLNPVPGKILGALGIVAPFIAGYLLWNWWGLDAFIAAL